MKKVLLFLPRLITAIILLQTLYFKFTAHPDSVYIFSTVGMEPWGRIGSGVAELIAGILLLLPNVYVLGALLSIGVISGAIFFHLTILGIEVHGDGGMLFGLAVIVFILSAFIVIYDWQKLKKFIPFNLPF